MKSIRNRLSSLLCVASSWCISGAALGQVPWYTVLEQAPNPAVVTDAALRLKIVDSGFPWRVRDIGTGIEMLLIPAGTFQMGASPGDGDANSDEIPAHQVTLTNAFYMGKTEVTQAQWQAKMGSNPSYFGNKPNNPVEKISWNMIQDFNAATGLRLPNEAEWEYACRAGTTTAQYGVLNDIAWYGSNSEGTTQVVATKLPNAFGLFDTIGNVWEWCQDWYSSTYYTSNPITNPAGPVLGTDRVARGGRWLPDPIYCRSSQRTFGSPSSVASSTGFRVARTASFFWSISGVLPVSGPSTGGTLIRINGTSGTNFPNPPVVTIGGVAATDVVWVSPVLITVVTPAGTPGMSVVDVNGVSAESFYYRPSCDGDLDNNGTIDSADLSLVLLNFGDCSSSLTNQQPQEPMIFPMPEVAKPIPVKK